MWGLIYIYISSLSLVYGGFIPGDFTRADFAEPLVSLDLEVKLWLLNVGPAVKRGMRRPVEDELVDTLHSVLPHYYQSSADHEETVSASSFADCRFEMRYKMHESGESADQEFLEDYRELILGQSINKLGHHIISTATLVEFLARKAPQALRSTLLELPMILIGGGEGAGKELPPHIIVTDEDAHSLREGRSPVGGLKCSKGLAALLAFFDDSAMDCAQLLEDGSPRKSNIYMHDLSYFTRLTRIVTSGVEAFASAGRLERRVAAVADRVIVPVIIFSRRSGEGKGIGGEGDSDMTVDTAALNDWARALVLPHQEVVVVTETLYVEDFPQVLVALRDAERAHVPAFPRHDDDGDGDVDAGVRVPYLDSRALLASLFGSHIDRPCLSDEGDLQDGSRGGVGTVLLARLLGRVGHGEAAVVEAAIRSALTSAAEGKNSGYSTTARLNDALSHWLGADDDAIPHDMDVEGPDDSRVSGQAASQHWNSNKVSLLPVILFSGLHSPISSSSSLHDVDGSFEGKHVIPLLDGRSEIAVMDWDDTEVRENPRGEASPRRGGSGGIVFGVHGPADDRLQCYSLVTSSWRACAKAYDVSDATKVVASGITSALTALKAPHLQSRAYQHFTHHHHHDPEVGDNAGEGVAERFWEGGVHPFGPQGVFPSETAFGTPSGRGRSAPPLPDAYASHKLDRAALLMTWSARRSVLLSRIHEAVHHAVTTLHHSRGVVQRLIMAMHMLSTGGISSHQDSSRSNENVYQRTKDRSTKTFLEHVDMLSLEEEGYAGEASRSKFLHFFEKENARRLKLRAGLAGDDATSDSTPQSDLVATGQALQYLASHVASHEAQIHYLQEKLDYATDALSSITSVALMGENGEEMSASLENLVESINLFASSFAEGESTLRMMESAIQTSLNTCEVHWDAVDDAAVYAHIQRRVQEDKLWFDKTRIGANGNTRGGSVRGNNHKSTGGLRGVLMYLLGMSKARDGPTSKAVHPSSAERVEQALKAVGQTYHTTERPGWPTTTLLVLLTVVALALSVAVLRLALVRIQGRVKKMA